MPETKRLIEEAYERRASLKPGDKVEAVVRETLARLDAGTLSIAEKISGEWTVNTFAKKAVVLAFRLFENRLMKDANGVPAFDKISMKFDGWDAARFNASGIRVVPGAIVRFGAFIGEGVVLMPSFVNIGAHIGKGTMIDTWATVGSCAQVGENVHISGGVGLGGVLEPVQADPVIIENNVFIGARSEVAEGVRVGEGAVLSMGVYLAKSTPIFDRETGTVSYGKIPPYAVVIPGTLPGKNGTSHATYAAIIVKRVDEKTRAKVAINELLRP